MGNAVLKGAGALAGHCMPRVNAKCPGLYGWNPSPPDEYARLPAKCHGLYGWNKPAHL